jgi:hypothetical protein
VFFVFLCKNYLQEQLFPYGVVPFIRMTHGAKGPFPLFRRNLYCLRSWLEAGMALSCRVCGYSNYRISRFRMPDLMHLMLLRLPARCRNCDERTFVSLRHYLVLLRAHKERHKADPVTK